MKVRVLKGFNGYRPGQVFDWADGMARILVARGMAEQIAEQPVERAMNEPRVERAVVEQPVRRKGK